MKTESRSSPSLTMLTLPKSPATDFHGEISTVERPLHYRHHTLFAFMGVTKAIKETVTRIGCLQWIISRLVT